jgi:hypothetical protein
MNRFGVRTRCGYTRPLVNLEIAVLTALHSKVDALSMREVTRWRW